MKDIHTYMHTYIYSNEGTCKRKHFAEKEVKEKIFFPPFHPTNILEGLIIII